MQEKNWFEDWFCSPYYHLLYNNRNDEEAAHFLHKLCEKLNLRPHAKIWDNACGKGRHCRVLAEKGFEVTGTDLSPKNIELALNHKYRSSEFYLHDMRNVFRINYFDCVFNLFTSMGYFENESDNVKVFQSVHAALKTEGLFVVDFFNKVKILNELIPVYTEKREKIEFHIAKKIIGNQINKSIKFEAEGRTFEYTEKVSLLGRSDFEQFAAQTNLKLIAVYGDYELGVFDEKSSDRLILIFKK